MGVTGAPWHPLTLAQVSGAQQSFPSEPQRKFQKEGDVHSAFRHQSNWRQWPQGQRAPRLQPVPLTPGTSPAPACREALDCGQPVRRVAPGVACGWQVSNGPSEAGSALGSLEGLAGASRAPAPLPQGPLYPLAWPLSKALQGFPSVRCADRETEARKVPGIYLLPPNQKQRQKQNTLGSCSL